MTFSKAARRIVAGLTAVVVMLCQSSALAHACAGNAAPAAATAAQPPCHSAGGNDAQEPAHDHHPAQCLSQAASSSPALPEIPPLAGLPALGVPAALLRTDGPGLAVSDPPPVRGEPPPLTILHCRLLV